MRVILELLRIIILFAILGGLAGAFLGFFYISIGVTQFQWIGYIAIYILLFILYRNKLQFSGWYNGKGGEKLSKVVTLSLLLTSGLLLVVPYLLSSVAE